MGGAKGLDGYNSQGTTILDPQQKLQKHLDVLDSLLDLLRAKMVVRHKLLPLPDGLLQVGRPAAHLVLQGLVLTQQAQRPRQVFPHIFRGEDLLLLPDPALLLTQSTTFRSGDLRDQRWWRSVGQEVWTHLLSHFPEELPEAPRLLKTSSPLGRQLTELLVAEVHVSHSVPYHLGVTWLVTWGR